jgi:hypothetical protein
MKARPSKLDTYAARIREMVAARQTLAQIQAELLTLGVKVSTGRLSVFVSQLAQSDLESRLFGLVKTGGQMTRELDAAFTSNPAPELAQLIRVVKTLVMNLQIQGATNPEMLDLSNTMLKTVLEFAKLESKEREVNLAVDKFQFDATKLALAKLPELKAIASDRSINEDEKLTQARLALFGFAPA